MKLVRTSVIWLFSFGAWGMTLPTIQAEDKAPAKLERYLNELNNPSIRVRQRAAQLLAGFDSHADRVVPALQARLTDEEKDVVRIEAATSLAAFGAAAAPATEDLLVMLGDSSKKVSDTAKYALVTIGVKAVPVLAEVASKPGKKRLAVVQVLAALGPLAVDSVPMLIRILEQSATLRENDSELLRATATALASIGPKAKAAVPVLIQSLKSRRIVEKDAPVIRIVESTPGDPFSPAFIEAAAALGAIGPDAIDAVPTIMDFLKLPDRAIVYQKNSRREAVVQALGGIGSGTKPIVVQLIHSLESSDDELRGAAAEAIGRLGPKAKDAIPALIELIRGFSDIQTVLDRGSTRERAIESLGKIGKDAVPALMELLAQRDAVSRRNAAVALGRIGADADEAVPDLIKAFADENQDNSGEAATQAVSRIGASAMPKLIEAMSHKSVLVRSRAIQVVGFLGPNAEAAIPQLVRAAKDPNSGIRSQAVVALGRCGKWKESVCAVLIERLGDDETFVRLRAGPAMIALGSESVPSLMLTLKSTDFRTINQRVNVSFVLSGVVSPNNDDHLLDLVAAMRNEDERIRRNVARAIGRMGVKAESALGSLRPLTTDKNKFLACEAALAISHIRSADRADMAAILIAIMNEPYSSDLAITASRLLGEMEATPETIDALKQAVLEGGHGYVRVNAALGLARLQPAATESVAANGMLEALNYSNVYSRVKIAKSLGSLGSRAAVAIPQLLRLHEESRQYGYRFLEFENTYSDDLRIAVEESLAKIDPDGRLTRLARQK